jgi:hypothetical protein
MYNGYIFNENAANNIYANKKRLSDNLSQCQVWGKGRNHKHETFKYRPDDGGSKHLWNVGQLLRYYTAPYPQKVVIFT